jgi:hypothetical protein
LRHIPPKTVKCGCDIILRWHMKLLPYEKFQIVVAEPLPQARERLLANVGPKRFWANFSSPVEHDFRGEIDGTSFKIWRNIHYRNSFLPVLHGSFEQRPDGTRISVRMGLHLFVIAFLAVWAGAAISFALPFTAVAFWAEIGQAGVMVGAAFLMTYAGFWFEAGKSKKVFLEIYQETKDNTPLEQSR